MTAMLARELLQRNNLKYSYRIIWVPETIGAITYCAFNEEKISNIKIGMVITTVGGKGMLSYKQSRDREHFINKYTEKTLRDLGEKYKTYPFDIHGSDERQFSSQGFGINMVTIAKDRYYEYPEYHSSLDNLDFVSGKNIARTLTVYLKLIENIENRILYKSKVTHCEAMLSKHNLYPQKGGEFLPGTRAKSELDLILWVLFLSDGDNALSEIADYLEVTESNIATIYSKLEKKNLVELI